MKLRRCSSLCLMAIFCFPLVFVSSAFAANAKHQTAIVHVKPFLPSGTVAPGYTVVARAKGYCFSTSVATRRTDAFRCFRGNAISDPCFRNVSGTQVACVEGTPSKILILTLTQKLPQPAPGGKPVAWALKLASGAYCQIDTGGTFMNSGKRANFACTDKSWLFGHANSKHNPWIIRKGHGPKGRLTWVKVVEAWF